MPYFAYNVGGWVQKEGKMCLRNKSMAPNLIHTTIWIWQKNKGQFIVLSRSSFKRRTIQLIKSISG